MSENNGNSNSGGGGISSLLKELPVDRLREEASGALSSLGQKALDMAKDKIGDATGSLTDFAEGGGVMKQAAAGGAEAAAEGDNPVMGAVKGTMSGAKDKVKSAFGGSGKGKGKGPSRSVNILETIDVGVPLKVAYNQWTQFDEFSDFMRKVESVSVQDETKLQWKAQIVWSHRIWTATVTEQVPDKRIVWKSEGQKGHVDGAVTFHKLDDELTRIMVVLEYYPQGLFEKTGNIWRAQGRRARSDLRHFKRHVMTRTILNQDEVEGWRGEIRDGEVVRSHEEVVEEEERQEQEQQDQYDDEGYDESEDGYDDEPEDEYDDEGEPEDEPEDEYDDEGEPEDEYDEGDAEEGYDDEGEPDEEPLEESA